MGHGWQGAGEGMIRRVLCVDDEPNILAAFARQLHKHVELDTAVGPLLGLEAIQSRGPYAAVVSDLRMPGMDGIRFLAKVHELAPDTVRVMLTGQADLTAAIAAVNEGHIFRFLTKPCLPTVLIKTLESAIEQYRLVTAEREILEETLNGSIRVLTEVLSVVNPAAFSRADRIHRYVAHQATYLWLPNVWEFEVAARLSHLGCIAVPSEIFEKLSAGESLSEVEQTVLASHPAVGQRLLENIPRFGAIARMIGGQQAEGPAICDEVSDGAEARIAMGAQMLKTAIEFDRLAGSGFNREAALTRMRERQHDYALPLLEALESVDVRTASREPRTIPVDELDTRMTIDEDVRARDGILLLRKGQDVTYSVIARLKNAVRTIGVQEPLRVLAPAGREPALAQPHRRDIRPGR